MQRLRELLNPPVQRPTLPVLLAGLMFILLLLAFQQVVARSVERGESLRRSLSEQAVAAWRCRQPATRQTRDGCPEPAPQARYDSIYAYQPARPAPGSAP